MTLFSSQAADRDTKLSSSVATRNFGVSVTILGAGGTEAMIIWWDLSSIPAGSIVNSATLTLYQAGSAAANAFTLTAYAILSGNGGWIEGTKNNQTALSGEPCWDAKEADGSGGVTTAWAGSAGLATSGTDFNATALGTVNGNRSDANGTGYAISLNTTAVAAMLGNSANYGIKVITSSGCGAIASAENSTSGWRPKLEIDYTETSGAISGSSAGSSTVSGLLAGAGALAGSAAGAGAPIAVLIGSGALSGLIAGAGDAAATLTGAGALAGTSAGAATVSGTLEQPPADGDISGVASGSALASGTLIGAGVLAGASSGAASVTATLAGVGDMSGSILGSATVSGLLAGYGSLEGSSAGAAVGVAFLAGAGALSGSAAGTSTATLQSVPQVDAPESRTGYVLAEQRSGVVIGSRTGVVAFEQRERQS